MAHCVQRKKTVEHFKRLFFVDETKRIEFNLIQADGECLDKMKC